MGLKDFKEGFFGPSSTSTDSDLLNDKSQGLGESHHIRASNQQGAVTTHSNNHLPNHRDHIGISSYDNNDTEAGTGPLSSRVPLPSRPHTADHLRRRLTTDAFEIPKEVALAFAALYQVSSECCPISYQ